MLCALESKVDVVGYVNVGILQRQTNNSSEYDFALYQHSCVHSYFASAVNVHYVCLVITVTRHNWPHISKKARNCFILKTYKRYYTV